jgi:hypothetical protein
MKLKDPVEEYCEPREGYDQTYFRVIDVRYEKDKHEWIEMKTISNSRLVVETNGPVDLGPIVDFYNEHGDKWPCKCAMSEKCMVPKTIVHRRKNEENVGGCTVILKGEILTKS